MKEISLTSGYVALVDDEDYERVSLFKWSATQKTISAGGEKYIYAQRWFRRSDGSGGTELLHRFIMNAKKGEWIDHKNGDRLNCSRENLRVATPSQNGHNRHLTRAKSGVRGVIFDKTRAKPWRAFIGAEGKMKHLGWYISKEEAISKRQSVEREMHGEFSGPA